MSNKEFKKKMNEIGYNGFRISGCLLQKKITYTFLIQYVVKTKKASRKLFNPLKNYLLYRF